MRPLLLPLAVALTACTFDPAAVAPGTADGALADAAGADAPVVDGMPDGMPVPDASPPDASCDDVNDPLALGTGFTPVDTTGATDDHSACGGGAPGTATAPDLRFRLASPGPGAELVFEVESVDVGFDPVLEASSVCRDPSPGDVFGCTDDYPAGRPELLVLREPHPDPTYVVVDGAGPSAGTASVRAFVRQLVSVGQACDRLAETSRCRVELSQHCLASSGGGAPQCTTVVPRPDPEFNYECLTDGTLGSPVTGDLVFAGTFNPSIPQDVVDVLHLRPASATHVTVVVYDPDDAGCEVDVRLELHEGSCSGSPLHEDNDSGLGVCPRLSTSPGTKLSGNTDYFLRVERERDDDFGDYTVVIDFHP